MKLFFLILILFPFSYCQVLNKSLQKSDTYNSVNYSSLSYKISLIGNTPDALIIDKIDTIRANLIIPSNLDLNFLSQGEIYVPLGDTLYIYGSINAPLKKIFSGSGFINLNSAKINYVNPEWWGNNEFALQRAINSASGKNIKINSTYTLTFPLEGKSGMILSGDKNAVLQTYSNINILNLTGFGEDTSAISVNALRDQNEVIVFHPEKFQSGDTVFIYQNNNVLIDTSFSEINIISSISGNKLLLQNPLGDSYYFKGAPYACTSGAIVKKLITINDVKISGIKFIGITNGNGNGIKINCAKHIEIKDCTFTNLPTGIYADTTDNITISFCTIFNNIGRGINLKRTDNSLVEYCNIENLIDTGIFLWQESNNNEIINCHINKIGKWGISVMRTSHNNKIVNNWIANAKDYGIVLDWDDDFSIITGNHIINSGSHTGLALTTSNFLTVNNNILEHIPGTGISLEVVNHSNVSNNILRIIGTEEAGKYPGISLNSGALGSCYNIINGNVIDSCQGYAIATNSNDSKDNYNIISNTIATSCRGGFAFATSFSNGAINNKFINNLIYPVTIYYPFSLNSITNTGDGTIITRQIDLSGCADSIIVMDASVNTYILWMSFSYSESSSPDDGIKLTVGNTTSDTFFISYVTERSKSKFYKKDFYINNLAHKYLLANDALILKSPGAKKGAGKVYLTVCYERN